MNYPLRILEAHLLKHETQTSTEQDEEGRYVWRGDDGEIESWSANNERSIFHHTEDLSAAHGVGFLCPLCFEKNNGNVGTHGLHIYWSPVVPLSLGQNRWNLDPTSTGLDDLALTPSIQIVGGCSWHGFIGTAGVPRGHAG